MRHKKKRHQDDVELNLTAMLDMAFQLLAFFILTFRPSPVEGQILLRMPPPQPITNVNSGQQAGNNPQNTNPLQGLNTLVISAFANGDGTLKQLSVGEAVMASLPALDRKLAAVLSDPGSGFDQVIVQVDSRLPCSALMQVIDTCTKHTLPSGQARSKRRFLELR